MSKRAEKWNFWGQWREGGGESGVITCVQDYYEMCENYFPGGNALKSVVPPKMALDDGMAFALLGEEWGYRGAKNVVMYYHMKKIHWTN